MELTRKCTQGVRPVTMNSILIMITYDFIDKVKSNTTPLEWSDVVYIMERLMNNIKEDTTLGHIIQKDGKDIFIEFDFFVDINEDNSYIVNNYEVVSSDRYLDLMLEERIIYLAIESLRTVSQDTI